jgi:hypothetical protein
MGGTMSNMKVIIRLWPTIRDLAEDVGVSTNTALSWSSNGSIPAKYDVALVRAAEVRGIALTYENLAMARSVQTRSKGTTHE